MASATESIQRSPFAADHLAPGIHKSIPILPSSSSSMNHTPDPMDVTPSVNMGPPSQSSPVTDRNPSSQQTSDNEPTTNGTSVSAVGAAAAAQQPKVVQTAFIHKLYNMLEDQNIQHLISWSSTNESFVMSPSTEFSKVLSTYFKHTNISSFVRQLNMYGFHKVSDVFHTGAPDSPLWEFKHGNGNFKRGDLVGLREIKRRASRHALIHRDSFSAGPKGSISAGPGETVPDQPPMPHSMEARLSALEHHYFDIHARLARSEDATSYLQHRVGVLTEGLMKCHQWNQDLAHYLTALVPDTENQIHKDVSSMRAEIARQTDILRSSTTSFEDSLSSAPPYSGREPYFAQLNDSGAPLSPRQMPTADRRPSQPSLLTEPSRTPFRAAHLAISPRRYGSISSGNSAYSPSSARTPAAPPPPPPPQHQHPLATVTSPPTNLPRRHTSADIRLHGWQGPGNPPSAQSTQGHSPYASGHNSTQWPSSPHRTPVGGSGGAPPSAADESSQLRSALAAYDLPRATGRSSRAVSPPAPPPSGPPVPPPYAGDRDDSGWTLPGARYSFRGGLDGSAPPTRRSSMASNVHSLLNPTAEGAEEGDEGGGKRKRVG